MDNNIEYSFCPTCGVKYCTGLNQEKMFFWEYKNTLTSQDEVINRVCKYIKDPVKASNCVNSQKVINPGQNWDGNIYVRKE